MKTAISLPDGVYDRATRGARELGVSRSELFAMSVTRYLDELDRASVTRLIDAALDGVDADDSNELAVSSGRRVLEASDEDW